MARKNKAKSNSKPAKKVRKPLRSTLAAFGVGLAWAALHMPSGDMGMLAGRAEQLTWLIHAVVAALAALCVLEIAGAALEWTFKTAGSLFTSIRG